MKGATIRLELDRRFRGIKDDRFRVALTVSYKGSKKRYATKCNFYESEWERFNGKGNKNEYIRETKLKLDGLYAKASHIAGKLDHTFTYNRFESLFFKEEPGLDPTIKETYEEIHSVYKVFERYCRELNISKQFGTADSYESTQKSFQKFRPNLIFEEITPAFLYEYEEWMLDQGMSITTVGINATQLRAIYNIAIADGLAFRDQYPFGMKNKRKYPIPQSRNIKKALKVEDLRKVMEAPFITVETEFAKAMWMFGFYCNGMNPGDIFYLQYEDIIDNHIYFRRQKTQFTSRKKTIPIKVYILDDVQKIIDKFGNKPCDPKTYIFSQIPPDAQPRQIYELKKRFVRFVDQGMAKIARHLGMSSNLGSNVARHSFATMLKHLGVPIEEISEYLGHSDIKTTQSYLDSFTDTHVENMANKLSDFVKGV